MLVIGISGKKQSGKTTAGNFIISLYLTQMGISSNTYIDDHGNIIVSDLLGDKSYEGIFSINELMSKPNKSENIEEMLKNLNDEIKIYSFADILKTDICMNILGLTYDQCYGSDDNKNEITNLKWEGQLLSARDVMQIIGTDIFRKLDTDVWVRSTLSKIRKDKPNIAIITDCRFPNEVSAIKNIGGKVIRLTRSPFISDHASETILDKDKYDWSNFDYIIDNSEFSLHDQLKEIQKTIQDIIIKS